MNKVLIKQSRVRNRWAAHCRECGKQLTVARHSWEMSALFGLIQIRRHKHLTQKDVMKSA